ncbi:MAG TPA: ABC transporter ATP-binding protein [Casimicrobiaceae bacterium]|nr:ABC transporter ATP-binding protein [Casimicrobiaceae bacterium]
MAAYLSIEDLSVGYGATTVLDRVSLDIERGEMIALLGSSGCGKTTLLRAVAGFVTPRAGAIRIEGRDLLALPPEQRGAAMMFQSYALWPHMSVAQNIGYGLRVTQTRSRMSREAIAARVEEMLALLKLEGFGPRQVTALSGGQRQRVALGRALAVSPALLLLDEPMSNLDYRVRLDLRHELRSLQQRIGITAIYVTHDREEALTLADRIAVLDAGRVAQYGTPQEVFHRPTSAFVAGFMGADNRLRLVQRDDGSLAAGEGAGPRLEAHFRADDARLAPSAIDPSPDTVTLSGVIEQVVYVGQGYRYRVKTAESRVWVNAIERVAEGTAVTVAVPRSALLLFPSSSASAARTDVPRAAEAEIESSSAT